MIIEIPLSIRNQSALSHCNETHRQLHKNA